MPVADERLEPVRGYLRQAFAQWELADQWDGDREAHSFRLTRPHELVHLLKVSREVLEDNEPVQLSALLVARGVSDALRQTASHRLVLTSHGLTDMGLPA